MRLITEGFEAFYRQNNTDENYLEGLNSLKGFTTTNTTILQKSDEQKYKDSNFSLKVQSVLNERASLFLNIEDEEEIFYRCNLFLNEDEGIYPIFQVDEFEDASNNDILIAFENYYDPFARTKITVYRELSVVAVVVLDNFYWFNWFTFEVNFKKGAEGYLKIKINREEILNYQQSIPDVNYLHFGEMAGVASGICYIDDVAINNSVGNINNTWADIGNVVLLDNISDIKNEDWEPSVTESAASILNNRPFNVNKFLENFSEGELEIEVENLINKLQDLSILYSTTCLSLFTRIKGKSKLLLKRGSLEKEYDLDLSDIEFGFKQIEIDGYKKENDISNKNLSIVKLLTENEE